MNADRAAGVGSMRVLLAIDGSEPSGLAIDLVADAAWPSGTGIDVLEVVDLASLVYGGPWPAVPAIAPDRIEEDFHEQAERTVHDAVARLSAPDREIHPEVIPGRPATVIVERATQMRADLIILGSRGHGTIESMVLGSVSAEVVDHAPCPVLVARGGATRRVLLGWDGSSGATRVADLLKTWPMFAGSAVRVVSVADVKFPWWTGFPEAGSAEMIPMYLETADAMRKEHEELAATMAAQLRSAGLTADQERRDGDPATEVLAAAAEWAADLIAIGTHGRTGLRRLLLGSVARNVLQHAPCSVLIVREETARR
jgi:nucleotide-binding universal stress UspA family protein